MFSLTTGIWFQSNTVQPRTCADFSDLFHYPRLDEVLRSHQPAHIFVSTFRFSLRFWRHLRGKCLRSLGVALSVLYAHRQSTFVAPAPKPNIVSMIHLVNLIAVMAHSLHRQSISNCDGRCIRASKIMPNQQSFDSKESYLYDKSCFLLRRPGCSLFFREAGDSRWVTA